MLQSFDQYYFHHLQNPILVLNIWQRKTPLFFLLQRYMATVTPPLAVPPSRLNCGATESSFLISSSHYIYRKKVTRGLEKMDTRKLVPKELLQNVSINSRRALSTKVFASSRVSTLTHQTKKSTTTYLFRTKNGDHVKVSVEMKNKKFEVSIEVSLLQKLVLCWGLFRSNSSSFMSRDFKSPNQDHKSNTTETPFVQKSSGSSTLELEFEANRTPFYFSFFLKSLSDVYSTNSFEIRSHRNTNFCVPIGFDPGHPIPLGLSLSANGSMNFAIFSRNAESVILCLYGDTSDRPTLEIDLDPYVNRSGDVWHVSISSDEPFITYGYRCKEKGAKFHSKRVLVDPYAKAIERFRGKISKGPTFDWTGAIRPNLPMEKLVVYRLNVMHFTKDKSSQLSTDIAGSFSGLSEKLQHFKDLGVNAVLLEPIFSFDEQKGPYFPHHFFASMNLYGPSSGSISNSMKEMVKKFHANGLEILLEVVFTHTAEECSLRELDNLSYYGDLGTRNALNCNFPIVQQMILDSLRYWVTEFHIDGFCFTNASSLMRGVHGEYLSRPPLIESISFDPILGKSKIIADFWDPLEMSTKEIPFPHWKRWAEMNSKFCNDVRTFLRGDGLISNLATRICGSGDVFSDGRAPEFSFNFIAKNFGLPLVDLVSFSDGKLASELSWNCGEEGPTKKTVVLERRLKQIRNFLFILYVSLGVPVLNMGDECGYSSGGSLSYNNRRNFGWNALGTGFSIQITKFISFFSSIRTRRSDLFQKRGFLTEESIDWHGINYQAPPKWEDPSSKFLAMTLKAAKSESQTDPESSDLGGDLFVAFNAGDRSENVVVPPAPEGMAWVRLVDTALPFPGFFSEDGVPIIEQMAGLITYDMKSRSCVLFESRIVK